MLWLAAAAEPPPATSAAPRTTVLAPGVTIAWQQRAVCVQSHVVLRRGALEFLACFGGKEHESILRLDAEAVPIYMALGLIGVQPGRRPGGGTPVSRPWVFAGSLRRPDQTLEADRSGVGIALVDFPDSLVCLAGSRSSRDAGLWATARTAVIPPANTPVEVVFRPAVPRRHEAVLGPAGRLEIDGGVGSAADLAEIVLLERRLQPTYVQVIGVTEARAVDVALLRGQLRRAGLPSVAVRFETGEAIPGATNPD